MLPNQLLIYDDNCPLCEWYSSLFTRYRFIPENGRVPFSRIDEDIAKSIDLDRGRNEIPLINTLDGTVLYGIDALLEILSTKYSVIKPLGNLPIINQVPRKFYKFISYNRKVIVARKCGHGGFDCAPDLNITYRLLFMFVFLVVNTIILFPVYRSFNIGGNDKGFAAIQLAHFALIGINLALAATMPKTRAIEWLGQVNMLALIALLLLVPGAVAARLVTLPSLFIYGYLALVSLLVFREYLRRMEYVGVLIDRPWVVAMNLLCMNGFIVYTIS